MTEHQLLLLMIGERDVQIVKLGQEIQNLKQIIEELTKKLNNGKLEPSDSK